jgi:hypothetical protein
MIHLRGLRLPQGLACKTAAEHAFLITRRLRSFEYFDLTGFDASLGNGADTQDGLYASQPMRAGQPPTAPYQRGTRCRGIDFGWRRRIDLDVHNPGAHHDICCPGSCATKILCRHLHRGIFIRSALLPGRSLRQLPIGSAFRSSHPLLRRSR